MSYRIGPGVPRSLSELSQFVHREFGAIQREAVRVDTKAQNALEDLTLISDDGKLHPNEKLQVVLRYAQLTGEQAGIEARADAYGITTEKTAYTTAISDLSDYLNGLNPLWTDVTQVTPIDRAEWNSYWVAVTDARQVLQNKIAERAGEEAKWSSVANDNGQRPEDGATVGATTEQVQTLNVVANPYANLLRNPTAEKGNSFWSDPAASPVQGGDGEGFFWLMPGASNSTHTHGSDQFRLNAGTQVTLALEMFAAGVTGGNFVADVEFFDSGGGFVGFSPRATASNGTGWARYHLTVTAPASTYRARVRVFLEAATSTGAAFRRLMLTASGVPMPFADTLTNERDQRNLPVCQSEVASVSTSSALSAVDNGSSAKINISAHVCQFGGYTVSYNAGSISGLSFSTKYFVYCDDPDSKGGTVAYYATTSLSVAKSSTGYKPLGEITTPSDGGSETTQPNPNDCVASGMWLLDGLLVDDAQAGDLIDVWNIGDVDSAKGPIDAIRPAHNVECVRITMESGAEVVCSVSTPVTGPGPDNEVRNAPDALGMRLGVLHDNEPLAWERVVSVEPVGTHTVYHLSCGNISFAAGTDPAHRVVTHNIYYKR